MKAFGQHTPAAVARRASLQLRFSVFTLQLCQPVPVPSVPEQGFAICKFQMQTSRPMARFTTDVNFRKCRVVRLLVGIEIPLQIG